jgi:hypothetical protein
MAAANKIFVPSVGPVCHSGSGACVLHLYVVCRAMTTQKFAPGTASGSVIEMVELTTSACVGMLDGVCVYYHIRFQSASVGGPKLWDFIRLQRVLPSPVGTSGEKAPKSNLQFT